MSYVVPSDVAAFTDQSVPAGLNTFIGEVNVSRLAAVIELADRTPERLLQLN
jgi:hypothetical protein